MKRLNQTMTVALAPSLNILAVRWSLFVDLFSLHRFYCSTFTNAWKFLPVDITMCKYIDVIIDSDVSVGLKNALQWVNMQKITYI